MIPEVATEAKVAVIALQQVVVEDHELTSAELAVGEAPRLDMPAVASALREKDSRVIESAEPGFLRAPVFGECGGRDGRVVGELERKREVLGD